MVDDADVYCALAELFRSSNLGHGTPLIVRSAVARPPWGAFELGCVGSTSVVYLFLRGCEILAACRSKSTFETLEASLEIVALAASGFNIEHQVFHV